MHNNRSRTRPRRKRPTRKNTNILPLTRVPSSKSWSRNVVQPEWDVVLAYQPNKSCLNAAASTCGIRFYANGAYDVDPVLGSTTMPGFTTYMGTSTTTGLYNYYRVIKIRYDLEFANLETFPIRAYTGFTNSDPGTTGNLQLPANPMFKSHLLAAKGGNDTCRFRDSKTVATILGSSGVESEDNFRGLYNSNPVDLVYLFAGGNSIAGAFVPNGLAVTGSIFMTIRFYDPKVEFQ